MMAKGKAEPDLFGAVEHRRGAVASSERFVPARLRCSLVYSYDVGLDELQHDIDALGWDVKDLRVEICSEPDYDDTTRTWLEVPGPAGCDWCPTGAKGRAAAAAAQRAKAAEKEARRRKREAKKKA